jgi:hypothetical protein
MTRQAEEGVKREQPVPLKSGVCEQAPLDWAGRYFYAKSAHFYLQNRG